MFRIVMLIAAFVAIFVTEYWTAAQAADGNRPLWLRDPAVSPDGTLVY